MKKIFSSNDDKLSEKAFPQSIVISIICIFLCIVALCSATYAWFTSSLSSGEIIIESSHFALNVRISDENGNEIAVITNEDGTQTCTLGTGVYTVVLTMTDETTASKGYCDITINSGEKKQTKSISNDPDVGTASFTFTLDVREDNTVLVFKSKWGISSSPDISDGDTLVVPAQPSETDTEVDTESETDTQPDAEVETEIGTDTDAETDTYADTDTDAATETEAEAETEIETNTETDI